MIVELKVSEIRRQVGKMVFVKRKYIPFSGLTYVEDKVIEVVGKNVRFDTLDWMHFDQISEIRTEKPVD